MANQNSQAVKATIPQKSIIEVFMDGCKKGYKSAVEMIIPAMVLGYVIVQFLKLTGVMDILSTVFGPVMGIFGLPGAAVVVLISAFFAKASGAATAAMLVADGVLSIPQATILYPACILMGTLVGHYVRIVLVSGTNKKWHGLLLGIPLFDAALAMILTRILLNLLGFSV